MQQPPSDHGVYRDPGALTIGSVHGDSDPVPKNGLVTKIISVLPSSVQNECNPTVCNIDP